MSKQQKETITISDKYTPEERQAIAAEVIEYIIKRTKEQGLDKNNRPFAGYSKAYKESLDFQIAGKSSAVNLELSGEMLNLLSLVDHGKGKITIGYEAGDPINGRVEGNRLGTYGNSTPVTRPRDFLGITKKDLTEILRKYPLRSEEKRQERVELLKTGEEVAMDILIRAQFDIEEE